MTAVRSSEVCTSVCICPWRTCCWLAVSAHLCVAMCGSPEHISVRTVGCYGLFLFISLGMCDGHPLGALQGPPRVCLVDGG